VHIVINERNSKMVNFAFSKGSEHDIHLKKDLLTPNASPQSKNVGEKNFLTIRQGKG
jgi:hypothetical protein